MYRKSDTRKSRSHYVMLTCATFSQSIPTDLNVMVQSAPTVKAQQARQWVEPLSGLLFLSKGEQHVFHMLDLITFQTCW